MLQNSCSRLDPAQPLSKIYSIWSQLIHIESPWYDLWWSRSWLHLLKDMRFSLHFLFIFSLFTHYLSLKIPIGLYRVISSSSKNLYWLWQDDLKLLWYLCHISNPCWTCLVSLNATMNELYWLILILIQSILHDFLIRVA